MRNIVILPLVLVLMLLAFAPSVDAENLPPEELDYLLAPIALYPDPLLAQVLLAAAFPWQIEEADHSLGAGMEYVDAQPWDVSVKAVARYPGVLDMMTDTPDWTTAVGQAYAGQPADVLASVQRLRREARAAGNLETNSEQEVVEIDGYIAIWPVDPQYIFVPEYDPGIVYAEPDGFDDGPAVSYGSGFPIGPWLNRDCDWPHHRIYDHNWTGTGGWIGRSRPLVQAMGAAVNRAITKPAVANREVVPSPPKVRRKEPKIEAFREQQPEPAPPSEPEVRRSEAARPAVQAPPREPDRPANAVSQAVQAIRAETRPEPAAKTDSRPADSRDTDKKR